MNRCEIVPLEPHILHAAEEKRHRQRLANAEQVRRNRARLEEIRHARESSRLALVTPVE